MSSIKKPPRILVVLGPTASGKSALAIRLARKFRGEIISADSRQVYRGMDIGTGKTMRKEMAGVPHHLLDVASPKQKFTVTRYQKLAGKVIKDILKRGKLPIVCGGTGLYIDALIYDWKLPEVKPNWRLRGELEKKSIGELFRRLEKLDPKRATEIDRHNRRRLVRALEIVITTGQSSHSNILQNVRMSEYNVLKIGVKLSDEELKRRIKNRLLARVKRGMVREVKQLRAQGLSWNRLDSFGLEYRWVSKFLRGEISRSEMIEKLNSEIWHYAKRQMTWFKRDKNMKWILKSSEAEGLTRGFLR
ncbi:MAG: hypothetical protein G01um101420_660 [Parcubacteria group bacterium Gr01-1014_20]|nr:MAG: hypothetical protein G01um101420_660 [Parcubacteria group bacterium Gr01-1014_20]